MEGFLLWVIIAIVLLFVVLPFVLRAVVPGLYVVVATVAYSVFVSLDVLFGAAIIPGAPWIMWAFWGAAIGAALAFWTIAPVYGRRRERPVIAALPFVAMVLLLILRTAAQGGL